MYDAIIVGARCAGSPTAMLLARKGYRTLLVDKARFPSDTMSTLVIWPHGAEILDRWGLLDRLAATGCPPIARNMIFDFGPFALKGGVPWRNKGRGGFCPRRTVLDKLLVDAAVASGAELREDFTVDSLLWNGDRVVGIQGHTHGGGQVTEHASVVIGADGAHSFVAKAVNAPEYDTKPPLITYYYSFFSGFEADDVEQHVRDHDGAACFPTHDGLTLVAHAWKCARFPEIRADVDSHCAKLHETMPSVKERMQQAKREEKWVGTAGVRNYFRKPFGPGWALVGDAGYDRDPITAQGITDAFTDAENLTEALDEAFSRRRPFDEVLGAYQVKRDTRVKPMYEFTCALAALEPPAPEEQQLFAALHGNQEATNQYFGAITGADPIPEFFSPENIGRIVGQKTSA